jgi:HRDC domain
MGLGAAPSMGLGAAPSMGLGAAPSMGLGAAPSSLWTEEQPNFCQLLVCAALNTHPATPHAAPATSSLSPTLPRLMLSKQDALGVALERSRRLCGTVYSSEKMSEAAYLDAAARWGVSLPAPGMAVLGALYAWRDATARRLDESTAYVLPRSTLLELARAPPGNAAELRARLGRGGGPLAGSCADELARVVAAGLAQAGGAAVGSKAAAAHARVPTGGSSGDATDPLGAAAPAATAPPALQPRALPTLKPKRSSSSRAILGSATATVLALQQQLEQQPEQQQQQPEQQQQQQKQPDQQQQQQPEQQQQQEQPELGQQPHGRPQLLQPVPRRKPPGSSSMAALLAGRPGTAAAAAQPPAECGGASAVQLAAIRAGLTLPFLSAGGGCAAATAASAAAAAAHTDGECPTAERRDPTPELFNRVSRAEVRAAMDTMLSGEQQTDSSPPAVLDHHHHHHQQQQQQDGDDGAPHCSSSAAFNTMTRQEQHLPSTGDGTTSSAAGPGASPGCQGGGVAPQQHSGQHGDLPGSHHSQRLPDMNADVDYVPLSGQPGGNKGGRRRRRGAAAADGGLLASDQQQQQQAQAALTVKRKVCSSITTHLVPLKPSITTRCAPYCLQCIFHYPQLLYTPCYHRCCCCV